MRSLFPFLALYRTHFGRLLLGVILTITGLSASIGLLSLSGWFLSASFLAGSALIFNFFYPSSGVRGLAVGRTVARYFERVVTHDATFRVLSNLRVAVFSKLIPLSPAKLQQYRHSELLNRLVADVDTLDTLYLNLVSPFVSAVMVIAFIGIGFSFISPQLAWVVCGILLGLLLLFPTLFYHLGLKSGKAAVQGRAAYRSQFIEWIQLNAEFVLFGIQQQKAQALQQAETLWLNAQSKESRLTGLSNGLMIFSNGVLVTLVIFLASSAISVENVDYPNALIALVVFCVLASLEILMPIGIAFLHLGQVITAARRINEITEQTPLVEFAGNAIWQKTERNQPLVRFQNVHFQYPNSQQWALTDLNFEIKQGEKVAILGKTGSGKSSIFQLLTRNYDPTSGEIELNFCNIRDFPESTLRQHLGTLSQRVHIFSSSLRENLQVGNLNASDEQLINVLEKVGLSQLLENEGLELWLGDGGRPLSGGEQRRLGLARLLLSDVEILLLDEPTEGLDRETEQQILSLIFEQSENKTLLMITHRLNQLDVFDRVMQLDNGKRVA